MKAVCWLGMLPLLFVACGGEQGWGSLQAELLVPRQLAENLDRVDVYLFETEANRPRCDELQQPEPFTGLESRAFKKTSINFPAVDTAVISAIPDRGTVWRFHARGLDAAGVLLGQGCDVGLYRLEDGQEIQVVLELKAIGSP